MGQVLDRETIIPRRLQSYRGISVEMTLTQEVLRTSRDKRVCLVLQESCTNGQSYCDFARLR